MAMVDNLIEDVAGRFGLGPKAGPLFQEVVQLMTGSPGGINGFIDKFRSAGFGSQVSSWLGRTDAPALTGPAVETALGSSVLGGMANRLGLGSGVVATAIGYFLPKLIGQITPGGVIPSGVPAALSGMLHPMGAAPMAAPMAQPIVTRRVEQVGPRAMTVIHDQPHLGRWLIPALLSLGVLGLFWYLLSGNRPAETVPPPPQPVQEAAPVIPSEPARLSITNDEGVITYSGSVHDESTRTSIMDALKGVFGADHVRGDITINANAGPAPWLVGLRNTMENFKTPGTQAVFDGNSLKVGGMLGDADRNSIISSLRTVLPAGLAVGALTDRLGNMVNEVNTRTATALTGLHPGFQAADLTNILNQSIINFPTNSAEMPATNRALLQQAAGAFKQLPAGTVVEIGGFTDNTGDQAANLQLSQQRADAVRAALIAGGVDPSMLVAKGYGSARPVASNETAEGRFHNRRIEYRVIHST